MRILVVEDDEQLRETLKKGLEAACFAVDVAADGNEGLALSAKHTYDVILLDNILPKKNGDVVCMELRKMGKKTPIIFLSVNNGIATKVQLLDTGADDYLTKPFSFDELLARIRALLRRPSEVVDEHLAFSDLEVDIRRHRAIRNKKEVYLTRKEFMLLEYLLRNQGFVVSQTTLLEHVWNSSTDPFSNTVESHMNSLRRKIDSDTRKRIIHTVPRRGYKIDFNR